MSATSKPKLYNPRHPERTLLYQTVAEHYETWLELASAGQFDGQGDHHTPKPFVRKAFATYLECGTSDKRGAKADELHLTPLELIDRIAALVPPPRTHRHRYFGVHPANTSWCAMPTEDLLAHKRVAVHSACRTTVPAPRRSTCRDFRPVKKGVAGSRLRRPVDPR